MFTGFEEMQKASKDSMDKAMASFDAVSKGMQSIAVEAADYSKKSFEDGAAHFEKLVGSKSLDTAIEAQTNYLKSSYEGAVSQATKIGELYVDLAKDVFKPFENFIPKSAK